MDKEKNVHFLRSNKKKKSFFLAFNDHHRCVYAVLLIGSNNLHIYPVRIKAKTSKILLWSITGKECAL